MLAATAARLPGAILTAIVLCPPATLAADDSREPPKLDLTAPLGSRVNPVRAFMPPGEREYLLRLRCPSGDAPTFKREGSYGSGPYDKVLDGYSVTCLSGYTARVFIDMYHAGYREMVPIPGFKLEEFPARLARGCPPAVPDAPAGGYVFSWMEVERPARMTQGSFLVQGQGLDGLARVAMTVDATGAPVASTIEITEASEAITAAALERAKAMRFEPALHHGECRVPQKTSFNLRFRDAAAKK